MKKRTPGDAPADPTQLAVGYMFPDLFADEPPLVLRSQEYDESPFEPSTTAQLAMPGMPPTDWNHIREKAAAERRRARQRARKRTTTAALTIRIANTDRKAEQ